MIVNGFWRRFAGACFIVVVATGLFVSCGPELGWGVVLWGDAAAGVPTASVVPVHVKSKITKTYIISKPDGKGKAELPVWKIALFEAKSKADRYAKQLLPNANLVAVAQRDGLPIREKPENTAKRVYRLRDKQLVKLLEKVDGAVVSSGSEPLSGDWYEVLTEDGAIGFAFSHYLTMFDEREGLAEEGDAEAQDTAVEVVFSKTWRPASFQTMIKEGRFNLDVFLPKYGLFADATQRQIRIELRESPFVFNYTGISKVKQNLFAFDGSTLQVRIRNEGSITASWSDASGAMRSQAFVTLAEDLQEAFRKEQARRQAKLDALMAGGASLASDAYGAISLSRSRRFSWTGYGSLVPDVIPEGAGESGTVSFDIYLAEGFTPGFEGVISLQFDALPPGDMIRFLYSRDSEGFRLEHLPRSCLDGNEAIKRAPGSPLIVFSGRAE